MRWIIGYKIKEIPKEERPREKVLQEGVDRLSNEELISIILKTGTSNKSAKDLAMEILKLEDNITNLKNITVPRLKKIHGIYNYDR